MKFTEYLQEDTDGAMKRLKSTAEEHQKMHNEIKKKGFALKKKSNVYGNSYEKKKGDTTHTIHTRSKVFAHHSTDSKGNRTKHASGEGHAALSKHLNK